MSTAVDIEHLFIVGAGFSRYAGLPLTSDFTECLLNVVGLKLDGPSSLQVKFLKEFVADTFDHGPKAAARYWPHLEDIFTCVDLSANSGHHLGSKYAPSDLRSVRRALIVRIIRMLRSRYVEGRNAANADWRVLDALFKSIQPTGTAFLSMNWDTVIEERTISTKAISAFDYGCEAIAANFQGKSDIVSVDVSTASTLTIIKPHGSANWLYCDSCRHVFWFPPSKTNIIADQLFRSSDWDVVEHFTGKRYATPGIRKRCRKCGARALGTRFATFSYRKALDFPMHASSWRTAEKLLQKARNWIFIGYSLPPADYEFKYLLKRVELSRTTEPNIILVTGGSAEMAEDTRRNYQKFFGPSLAASNANVFVDGLSSTALSRLRKLGILKLTVGGKSSAKHAGRR